MAAHLALILHAHLPYVRPAGPEILEERWLHEAVAETYLPLLQGLERLQAGGVPARLTVSLSGPLLSMLADPGLMARTRAYLVRAGELAAREARRLRDTDLALAASFHRDHFAALLADFDRREGRLLPAFRALAAAGLLELVTAAGSHAYLPLLATDAGRRAQVEAGLQEFEQHFGHRPAGIWLPECAYCPGLDHVLAAAGIRWFVAEATAVTAAWPPFAGAPPHPVRTPGGLTAFGRDPLTSKQVWSSVGGYPGDPVYREFYRDAGYDLPLADVAPYIVEGRVRCDTGLKFYRVTGHGVDMGAKAPYVPEWAAERALEHAHHFAGTLRERAGQVPPGAVIVAPFDAELFGHWWFEGPRFLEHLLRELAAAPDVVATTPTAWLETAPPAPLTRLPASSWGEGGDHRVWVAPANDWLWPRVHAAEADMLAAAAAAAGPADAAGTATPERLNQAARELILAQASDWPFIMYWRTTVQYAETRVCRHLERFRALLDGTGDPGAYAVEDGLFPGLDALALYGPRPPAPSPGEPLRILMLSWEFPPGNVGGLGRHVAELGGALAAAGHVVHVCTLADDMAGPGTRQEGDLVVHRVARPPEDGPFLSWVYAYNLSLVQAAEAAARSHGPFDLVHSHDWLAGQAGLALRARWLVPLVATIHATEKGRNHGIHGDLQQAIHDEEWLLTAAASQVITVSQAMGEEVQAGFGVPPGRLHVIHNGVVPPAPPGPRPRDFRDEPYFFFIGRLVAEKGVQVAIRALARLGARAHLVVAGKGPLEDELKQLAADRGVADRVHFVGRVADEIKDTWLGHAAAGLVPSLYEPFGIVALEAMAAGVPVVVSDTGGLSEIVSDGVDGFRCPPGDDRALARVLGRLLADPVLAGSLAAAGRRTAAERFAWTAIAGQTLAVYRGALGEPALIRR